MDQVVIHSDPPVKRVAPSTGWNAEIDRKKAEYQKAKEEP